MPDNIEGWGYGETEEEEEVENLLEGSKGIGTLPLLLPLALALGLVVMGIPKPGDNERE